MVKLSSYTSAMPEGRFELFPWEFWTEEEKSHVIKQAYSQQVLTSKQINPYLKASKHHAITQYLLPIGSAVLYFGPMRQTVCRSWFRKSPYFGIAGGLAFVGFTTLYWLNCSPFYAKKEKLQEKMLDIVYKKVGTKMKLMNTILPRSKTSTSLDNQARKTYNLRHSSIAGTWAAEEDITPFINLKNPSLQYGTNRLYS